MYNERIAYTTVGEVAMGEGVISEKLLQEVEVREQQCLAAIEQQMPKAGDFCENITVRWLYEGPNAAAGARCVSGMSGGPALGKFC